MRDCEHLFFGFFLSATAVSMAAKFGWTPLLKDNPVTTIVFTEIGTLLPNIDEYDSLISKVMPHISKAIYSRYEERTITHDLMPALILFIISIFVGNHIFFGIMLGIMSHLFLDSLTDKGIVFNYPYNYQFWDSYGINYSGRGMVHLLPRRLQFSRHGIVSIIVNVLLCVAISCFWDKYDLWSLYPAIDYSMLTMNNFKYFYC